MGFRTKTAIGSNVIKMLLYNYSKVIIYNFLT